MRSALYFPDTKVKSEALMKSSLLMWDKLEYILPPGFGRPYYDTTRNPERAYAMQESIELIGSPLVPNGTEKLKAHTLLEDLVTGPLPEPFYYKRVENTPGYEMYPGKLLDNTWHMLGDLNIARKLGIEDEHGYGLSEAAGLSVMSVLADCCAGETRARITDRPLAYATIANLPVTRPTHAVLDEPQISVRTTLQLLNLSDIPLRNLIEFRKREASESSGYTYTILRHNYLNKVEQHVKDKSNEKNTERDIKQLEQEFEVDMKKDQKKLVEELWQAKKEAIVSKESFAALGLAFGAIAAAHIVPFVIPAAVVSSPGAIIGGAVLAANKYAAKRREILEKHPMAYLYELDASR